MINFIAFAADATVPAWMQKWLNVSSPWEVWWLLLGAAATAAFTLRWIVQWVASERRGESVVPTAFWWSSLIGATMLLVYYIGRREPIGVLGTAIGWAVYGRNLYLIRHRGSENRTRRR
jgi:lipid-A-disaccharide synthase-like uncharacterized protein